MKNTISSALFALVLLSGVNLEASDALKAIVGSYLQIQSALAVDKTDGVKPAAHAIGEQAARMGNDGETLVKAARAVEEAAALEAVRAAFGTLSEAVIAAGDAQGWKDVTDVRVAFCPMAKKPWLQKESEIRNPYYGKSMPTCGEFKKKI